ncbi:hypothetical protein CAP36_07275 [Chitinophagaceae bacterium IBVUCB2]|nr:hypothetical protein CAP36_07275 [Chitinophagaceae bacterium IBVUCB2]
MIVYNVTVKTENAIAGEYVKWLKEEHIPEIIKTGCFTEARILRLLEIDESDGPTFAVQYHANSKALYNRYIQNFSDEMRKKSADKWGQKVIAFRSVMEVVH